MEFYSPVIHFWGDKRFTITPFQFSGYGTQYGQQQKFDEPGKEIINIINLQKHLMATMKLMGMMLKTYQVTE